MNIIQKMKLENLIPTEGFIIFLLPRTLFYHDKE